MRYYDIQIKDKSGKIWYPQGFQSLGLNTSFTSFVNGQTLPGALNVEIDAPIIDFATPQGGAYVKIWGVSLKDIAQANNLNGFSIIVSAGMQKGLPLANASQSGVILSGYIYQPFGNWIGPEQSLDLIIQPGAAPDTVPNIVHTWKKGTVLKTAIGQTLSAAFPNIKRNIQISENLVLTQDDVGYYNSLPEYAQYVKNASIGVLGKSQENYPGVRITLSQNTFNVFDGTVKGKAIQIAFQDLIGQPTWIGPQQVQFKAVMRADIHVGDTIQLPQTIYTTTQQSFSQFRQSSAFKGEFSTQSVHHFGNFRQADAASWGTVFEAFTS